MALKTNRIIVFALFWISVIFQLTGLKFIWSIENIARIVNFLVLIVLIIYSIRVIFNGHYSQTIWIYYILPGLLVFGGFFLNISINVLSNLKLISFFGLTLPWLTYLIIPNLMKKGTINTKILWQYFYYFMLLANILGLFDYILVFYGVPSLRVLETPNGIFLGGNFSLLHMLEDGTAHYRYYSCFMEPGTLAMYLLPAITYAFFNKKYFGLILFLIALYFTDSLGGIISLLILISIISFLIINKRRGYLLISIILFITISSVLWINFRESIKDKYQSKTSSENTREDNFTKTISNLHILFLENPLGIKLEENTGRFENNKIYVGSNFTPGIYLQYGGIIAFFGYIICLFVSFKFSFKNIKRNNLSLEEKVIFSSILVLLPFIFQRTTIWESSLFAFLFAPTIIRAIQTDKNK